ncbi:MAG: histidine phosphatase family protein [Acidimicrobiales bacterium]
MLILVRHGQSALNAKGVLVGRSDPGLTDLGLLQAMAIGEAVASGGQGSFRLLTSPLGRARETAAAIAEASDKKGREVAGPDVDERLVELDYGSYDGTSPGDLPAGTWQAWRSDPSFRPPGGESLSDLHKRCDPLWAELASKAAPAEGDVVAVSHVSPIKAAVAWALGAGPELAWRLHLQVASITRISTGPGGVCLVSFGEIGHLASVRR